ncbi:SGS-domain-containing protein [Atractiella rhizophila]|nr:SGS-domain-containing protein [Atractiella rhizophila]
MSDPTPSAAPVDPKPRIRHEWYQTDTHIYISIFIRSVPPSTSQDVVTLTASSLHLSLPSPASPGSTVEFLIEPLAHEVKPETKVVRFLTPKVEVAVEKKDRGNRWGVLEGEEKVVSKMAEGSDGGRGYPTSSKKKTNWDALEAEQIKEEDQGPDKDDPNTGGDRELNRLFQKLYKGATDEQRLAMMKSYQESNGTALSTNWDEVRKGKVETKPPDGMIAKKWNQ